MHSLLLISFPHQLLHALSALKYYRLREGIPDQAPAIILVWAHQTEEHASNSSFRKILKHMLLEFTHIRVIFPKLSERRYHLSQFRTIVYRIYRIRTILETNNNIDAIFFSHDASADQTAQVLMQSFSKADPICFGDPPGFLYPQFHSIYQENFLKRQFWVSRARGLTSLILPKISIVTIDFYNNLNTTNGKVLVLPREIVIQTLSSLQRGITEIKEELRIDYANLVGNANSLSILLISNFSESGLIDIHKELALYSDICKNFISSDCKLIIKPHFGTNIRFLKRLSNSLSLYSPEIFTSLAGQIPIELFPELVRRSTIISVSSSSALLAHLFDTKISHALTRTRILQNFKANRVPYMLEANHAIENSLLASIGRVPSVT